MSKEKFFAGEQAKEIRRKRTLMGKKLINVTKPIYAMPKINFFDKLFYGVKTMDVKIIDFVKKQLTGLISRWVLKIGGGFFVAIGVESGTIETTIGGILAIVIGLVISLIQGKKLANTEPAELKKLQ